MPYLGSTPNASFSTRTKQDFTANGSTTALLTVNAVVLPFAVKSCLVLVEKLAFGVLPRYGIDYSPYAFSMKPRTTSSAEQVPAFTLRISAASKIYF